MKKPKLNRVRKVGVNVCPNDSVDRRCGGPAYLGFDFQVDGKEWSEKAIREFIHEELKRAGLPCMSMHVGRPVWATGCVWTRLGMKRCIRAYRI